MEDNGPQKIWAIHDGYLTTEENSERFCTTYMYTIKYIKMMVMKFFFWSDSNNITQPIASGEVDETPPDSFYQKSHFSASLSNKTSPTS